MFNKRMPSELAEIGMNVIMPDEHYTYSSHAETAMKNLAAKELHTTTVTEAELEIFIEFEESVVWDENCGVIDRNSSLKEAFDTFCDSAQWAAEAERELPRPHRNVIGVPVRRRANCSVSVRRTGRKIRTGS